MLLANTRDGKSEVIGMINQYEEYFAETLDIPQPAATRR
jgi:hypothetical protein